MLLERLIRKLGGNADMSFRPNLEARMATYPLPFPNGWYRLAGSTDIERGKAKYYEACGQQLVAFRSDVDNRISVLDAHCPHLGANLAGGDVKDGCIECPFHKWTIGQDGRVEDVPYQKDHKGSLRTRAWPSVEMHGMIFFYFGNNRSNRADAIVPQFEFGPNPDIESGKLVYRGEYDAGSVDMHMVEFAENAVDYAHFEPLHGRMVAPFLGFKLPFLSVRHVATWEPDELVEHKAYFRNHATMKVFGKPIEKTSADATITFYGAGNTTTFKFEIPEVGEILLFHTHLPVEPLKLDVKFRWFAEPHIPRLLVYYVVGNWISQWRADIQIWENKVYRAKPMLVANDGPIHRMRKWYKQFYRDPVYESDGSSRQKSPRPVDGAAA